MNPVQRLVSAISRSPLVWGAVATCGFYALIELDILGGAFVRRYFGSHPVEYVATALFFVAAAALVAKLLDLLPQLREADPRLPQPAGSETRHVRETCDQLLHHLDGMPVARQRGYLVGRIREAVEAVRQAGHAERLGDELKYLAELDAARSHASYGLVRIIVWAIPILGFLGTVIGITLAIANLAPEALEESLTDVTAGLGVAFDTTALALALSILLMFGQFITARIDTYVLDLTDTRAASALSGCFTARGVDDDPQLLQLHRVTEALVTATEKLVARQAALWQQSIEAAHNQWAEVTTGARRELETALTTALDRSAERHAATHQAFWSDISGTLTDCVQHLNHHQEQLASNGKVMLKVLEATGHVKNLEHSLNENLHALAASNDFEKTLLSLSANVNLLSARLGVDASAAKRVDLGTAQGNAAA